jgi:hypothetical protein
LEPRQKGLQLAGKALGVADKPFETTAKDFEMTSKADSGPTIEYKAPATAGAL